MKGACSLTVLLAAMAYAPASIAAEPTAAELYDRGAAAYDAGDYARAVGDLVRADAIAPEPITLELALKATLRADDAAHGMELAERAESRKLPPAVASLAAQARGRFAAHAGKVHVSCDTPCEPRLDDTPMGTTSWATVGRHTVSFHRGGRTDLVAVNVIAEKTVDASPPSTQPPSSAPPGPAKGTERSGRSPLLFWIAAGVAVAAGAATAISAVDTSSKYDAFALDRANVNASEAGSSAQARTNALAVVTGGAALAAIALGLFVVRW